MELLALHISPTLARECFLTASNSKSCVFPRYVRNRHGKSRFRFQARKGGSRSWNPNKISRLDLIQQVLERNNLIEDSQEEDEDEISGDDSSFLSLSEKPDRNMALLDEYELEELDFTSPTNHRSGSLRSTPFVVVRTCQRFHLSVVVLYLDGGSNVGYVAVLGKPNVGKSTLANQMIGQKLSIVTDKPQTTRHRVLGICSGPEYQFLNHIGQSCSIPNSYGPELCLQMILYDTPGVIEKKMHKLDSMMMKNVRSAALNADCVLVIVDACKVPENINEVLEEGVGDFKCTLPTLLVLNKKDLIKPGEIAKKLEWYEKFTDVDEVIPVSAKYGHGVDDIKDWILSKLPTGPPYYPKDIVSEHPERFFVAEIVREKIFMQYRNEVPYACQVNVVSYKTRPNAKEFIQVEIVVEKDSQKIILIGK
ncbi:hypothetical protein Goshw_027762, partial [Gossypium schwendimanii]|nr:hypothetical protein [Gossypium schwendimanii]